jgi:hypothetical protein
MNKNARSVAIFFMMTIVDLLMKLAEQIYLLILS